MPEIPTRASMGSAVSHQGSHEDAKLNADLADLWRIIEGVEVYAKLTTKEMFERWKAHQEDCLCNIRNASDSQDVPCTRDAYEAAFDLAERHINSLPNAEDYSAEEVAAAIRRNVGRCLVEENSDEPALRRVLKESMDLAESAHITQTYHFPCVLAKPTDSPQFRIGPVIFSQEKAFTELIRSDLKEYVDEDKSGGFAENQVRSFEDYIERLGWVATVTVPPAAKDASLKRAEKTVSTAINLLRLVIGIPHSRDMRLVHLAATKPFEVHYATHSRGKLGLVTSKSFSGALLKDEWPALILDGNPDLWHRAAHVLQVCLDAKRSEMANRVIDALSWFGEAAFESDPGTRIAKFVAALERLTTTHKFSEHVFCTRVALLAQDHESRDFVRCYREALRVYIARSEIMHGATSPANPKFFRQLRLAHDLTRTAIFRALEIHCLLDDQEGKSSTNDLNNFFNSQQSKRVMQMEKLKAELKAMRTTST